MERSPSNPFLCQLPPIRAEADKHDSYVRRFPHALILSSSQSSSPSCWELRALFLSNMVNLLTRGLGIFAFGPLASFQRTSLRSQYGAASATFQFILLESKASRLRGSLELYDEVVRFTSLMMSDGGSMAAYGAMLFGAVSQPPMMGLAKWSYWLMGDKPSRSSILFNALLVS